MNLKIEKGEVEILVENLAKKHVPAYFRGAYIVYEEEKEEDGIDFLIEDPAG